MTPSRTDLTRLFPAAALIAALGLPMTACAQAQANAVEEQPAAEAVEAETVEMTKIEPAKPAESAEPEEEEKSPEEIAKEEAKKELDKLQREAQLRSARLQAELAPLKDEKQRIETQLSLLNTKQQESHAEARREKERADFLASLRLAEMSRQMQAMQQQMQQMQTQLQLDNLKNQKETAKLTAENAKLSAKASAVQAELSYMQTKRNAASVDRDEMQYPAKPMQGKTLTISDRRIPLNGAIGGGTADYVTERIHYYNNLNEKAPIFIVIDNCPGGSVMEGFRIVTAMENSKAPVHVVVKSFAASMAAVITTLAEESYAYPNAIILHHQMSSGMRGNLTQQKESLEEGFEWAKRLAVPVADKMGVSYDDFVEQMYDNNSDGDWAEFADKAKELKWVNNVVEEIRELALITAPTSINGGFIFFQAENPEQQAATTPRAFTQDELFRSPIQFQTKIDGNGRAYTELPKLSPYDYYFMHDPQDSYRIAK